MKTQQKYAHTYDITHKLYENTKNILHFYNIEQNKHDYMCMTHKNVKNMNTCVI